MRAVFAITLALLFACPNFAQNAAQKIYETEKAFEKMAAEKGTSAAFLDYLTKDAVMFLPDEVNAHEAWRKRVGSPALLTWNPILIDVSTNGVLAYSIGNSIFRAKGKDDPVGYAGHYLSIWMRQPTGEYRAVFDTGISHETSATSPTEWKRPVTATNTRQVFGADTILYFDNAEKVGLHDLYKPFLSQDVYLMRDGKMPFVGRRAGLDHLKSVGGSVSFVKRRAFVEAGDLAYVHGGYFLYDKSKRETERGNFAQVWKLIADRWQIVADVFVPLPAEKK